MEISSHSRQLVGCQMPNFFSRIAGLSPILVKEIFTIIRRVNEEQGTSILLVEQNAKVALETAHYGYVLEIGRVVMNDTCDRLMHSQDIQEFYLGAKEAGARGERRWKKKKTWR